MITESIENAREAVDVAQATQQPQSKLREIFAKDLVEYLQAVKKLSNAAGATWFRGQSKRSYHLEPEELAFLNEPGSSF